MANQLAAFKGRTRALSISELERACGYYSRSELECDGLTRVLASVLTLYKVDFKIFAGSLSYQDEFCVLHFWIESELTRREIPIRHAVGMRCRGAVAPISQVSAQNIYQYLLPENAIHSKI